METVCYERSAATDACARCATSALHTGMKVVHDGVSDIRAGVPPPTTPPLLSCRPMRALQHVRYRRSVCCYQVTELPDLVRPTQVNAATCLPACFANPYARD
eukprot:2601401-Rhodomonas_salina.1